jgi:iron complex transport system permease protein
VTGRLHPRLGAVGLVALLAALVVASAGAGAVAIGPGEVARIVLGAPVGSVDPVHAAVLLGIRLPRVALAVVVGAGLGVSGAVLQGLFRNPLADPGLLGVSSGAALAAAGAVALVHPVQTFGLPVAAFVGSVAATGSVLALTRRSPGTAADLLLAGIGVNAICGAGVGMLVFVADEAALRSFTFWTLGSLGGATWPRFWIALVGAGAPAVAAPLELPVGVVTTAIGGPFLLWLLGRRGR